MARSIWAAAALLGLGLVLLSAGTAAIFGTGPYLPLLVASWVAFVITALRALAPRFFGHLHVFPHAAVWRPAPGVFTVTRELRRNENDRSRLGALVAMIFALTNGWLVVLSLGGAAGTLELYAGTGDVLAVALVAFVLVAGMIVFGRITEARSLEFLSTLRGGASVPGWVVFEGIATSAFQGALVTVRTTVLEVRRGASRGRRTVHAMERSVEGPTEVRVETRDGGEWTVRLDGAVVASARPVRETISSDGRREFVQRVVEGDRVLVGGYADPAKRTVEAAGPDSLVLLFTPPRASPEAVAAKPRVWAASWLALAALDATALAAALLLVATS